MHLVVYFRAVYCPTQILTLTKCDQNLTYYPINKLFYYTSGCRFLKIYSITLEIFDSFVATVILFSHD